MRRRNVQGPRVHLIRLLRGAATLALVLLASVAVAQTCPNGGVPQGGCTLPPSACGCAPNLQPNQCFPSATGPALWTDPGLSTGARTTQIRTALKSARTNQYGTLPQNARPNCSYVAPPSPEGTVRLVGRRLVVDYDVPNGYCTSNAGDWPSGYTCVNDIEVSGGDRVSLFQNGTILLRRAWLYFESGQWDSLVDVPCDGATVTYQAAIRVNGIGTFLPGQSITHPTAETCNRRDRGTCPSSVGQPINVGSGDVSATILPIFTIAQEPLPLMFGLSYHSSPLTYATVSVPEPIGKGFTHSFNQSLKSIPGSTPQRLYHYTADGREFEYTQSGSAWVASRPAELRGTVTADAGTSEYRITDLDSTVTAFDQATGRWKRTADRWGNTITGGYSGSNLTSITDSVGRVVTLTYSGSVVQSITVPETPSPRVWTFSYNGANTLLFGIRDPLHPVTNWRSFGYDAGDRLASITDDASKTLEGHTYDAQGRGLTSYSEGGLKDLVTVEYDTPFVGQTRVTSRIDGATNQASVFSLVYQGGRWLPTQIVGPCATCSGASGDTQSFTYYPDNRPDTMTDGRGNVTKYVYDSNANVTSMKEAFGTSLEREATWAYAFGAWPNFWTTKTEPSVVSGTKTTTRAFSGGETTLTVDEAGKLVGGASETHTTVQTFDARHRLLSMNGPLAGAGDTTTYAYFADAPVSNDAGRLSSTTDAVSLQTSYSSYDVFGTARTMTAPDGVVTTLQTDARGRTTQRSVGPWAETPTLPPTRRSSTTTPETGCRRPRCRSATPCRTSTRTARTASFKPFGSHQTPTSRSASSTP